MKSTHVLETMLVADEMIGVRLTRTYHRTVDTEVRVLNGVLTQEEAENLVHALCLNLNLPSPVEHHEMVDADNLRV